MSKLNKVLIVIAGILVVFIIGGLVFKSQYDKNLNLNIKTAYTVEVTSGETYNSIIDEMAENKIINSKAMAKLYFKLNSDKYKNLVPDVYVFGKGTTLDEAFKLMSVGNEIKQISFRTNEGETLEVYAASLAKAFDDGTTAEDILAFWDDRSYVQGLFVDYPMLTADVLSVQIYHPLEGYLAPNTYFFDSAKFNFENMDSITRKFLGQRQAEINSLNLSFNQPDVQNVHDLLTLSSVVEREALQLTDRKIVAGIFFNRLSQGISLGSDITTYYGSRVAIHERDLTVDELNDNNGYNTRGSLIGLPIGPVNNPSLSSIDATINYTTNDYIYFVSDKNGKMYYNKTEADHDATVEDLKSKGLWFVWN